MATLIAWSPAAEARDGSISISARTLPEALAELAREERVSIGTEGTLPRVRTPRILRATSVDATLAQLLAGTGLVARQVGPSAWRIERQATARTGNGTRSPDPSPLIAEAAPTLPIVVTATKRAQALADAPVALSVVRLPDGEDTDAGRDNAWVAGQMEGIALAGQGPGRNRMFLRGVADSPFNGDSQSTVAVILDDSRLTYSAPDPDIRLVDVDRVEVLKGPQGALYGTGALGGIYRIVTRRPEVSDAAFTVTAGAEALSHGGIGQSGSAMANLPLARERVALRLVAYGAREPGWVDTGAEEDSNTDSAIGLRAGLGVEAGDGWRLDATAFGQWLNSADSTYVYADGARSRPAQLPEPHDNDLRHISLSLRRDGAIDVLVASGATWHEVRDRYDATQGAEGLGLADPSLLDDDRLYRTWDSELRFSGATGPFDWLAGLSHVEARQTAERALQSNSGAALTIEDDRRIATDSALFGEATLALSSELDLLLGGRLFRTHFRDTRAAGPLSLAVSRTRLGMTPSAALSWRPRRGRLLYLRYGSAFRQGGTDVNDAGGLEDLAGDELATLEAGWREEVGSAVLELGAYHSRWEDLQSDFLRRPGVLGTRNAGNARIFGLEASFVGRLASGWTASAGATWQSALLVRNETGVEIDDRRLPAVPHYTLRSALSHNLMLGRFEADVGLTLRYIGPARLSFDPALDLPMGDYLESALNVSAKFDRLTAEFRLENLFGANADTLPYGNPLRVLTTRLYTPHSPASLSLQLTWSL